MKYMKSYFWFSCFVMIFTNNAAALSLIPVTITELFDQSDGVAHVKVTKMEMKNESFSDRQCEGVVRYSFKGELNKNISFQCSYNVNVGNEYIFFLNRKESYALISSHDKSFAIDNILEIIIEEKWIQLPTLDIVVPPNIKTKDILFSAENAPEMYSNYHSKTLMEWEGFKDFLLEQENRSKNLERLSQIAISHIKNSYHEKFETLDPDPEIREYDEYWEIEFMPKELKEKGLVLIGNAPIVWIDKKTFNVINKTNDLKPQ